MALCSLAAPRYRRRMEIRAAVPADAAAIADVLRRSIIELCHADHGGDPTVLARWTQNKTPENALAWMNAPGQAMLVAIEAGRLAAVGLVTSEGEVRLNYVAPEARFRGISRALMAALEVRARAFGASLCTLTSTATARRFYRSGGYVEAGVEPGLASGRSLYRMAKRL